VLATSSLHSFFDAVGKFFSSLAHIGWGALVLGMLFHALNLTFRSRAAFNVLRAAYPAERFQWRRIWGAYVGGVGFNSVVPARGGDVIKLFLTKSSIPNSSYPAIGASLAVDAIFDSSIGVIVLIFAFTQGVFPKPPDFSKLHAFDLSFFANHPRFALFFLTLLAVLALVGFALLSARVKAFWARVRQGLTILLDRRRYLREVYALQGCGWLCRFAGFWFLLDAFHVGGSVRNVLLVFGVNAVSTIVPFTPGGAGVQQALLVKVFAGTAGGATVAAYSVGQQIAIAATSFGLGLAAVFFIFRFRSFKEVIHAGRADEEREKARRAPPPSSDPAAPRARG
jgi:glycosyltransferase 2 family protein